MRKSTTKYDRCGFKVPLKMKEKEVEKETGKSSIIYPSRKYKNIYAFLDDPDLKPLHFKEY